MQLRWVWMLVAVGVLVVAISSYMSSSCGAAAAAGATVGTVASIGTPASAEAGGAAPRLESPQPRNAEIEEFERACAPFFPSFETGTFQGEGDVKGKDGGGWSPCTHLKIYGLNFAPFFARFLAYQLQPETTLELGCGLGTTSDFIARSTGASVTCIEPEQTLATLIGSLRKDNLGNGHFRQLALNIFDKEPAKASCTESIPQVDLVFSLEVAEHIPVQFHERLVELLASRTKKWLVFSAARPGQLGTGHVNESMFTREEWQRRWTSAGLQFMPKLTAIARRTAFPIRQYDLFGNVNVFKNPAHPAEDTSEPHEMLANFMYAGFDLKRFEKEYGNQTYRDKAARAFAEGSNTAMWPSLTLWEQKAKRGLMCSGATGRKLAAVGSNTHTGGSREEGVPLETDLPMESAWAWQFYTGALPK